MQAERNPVVVLDFGAQYSKLIARRVRESRVFSLILPYNTSIEVLRGLEPGAIIFSGGPASVHAEGAPLPDPEVFDLGVPILGICYGVQLFAHMLGGKVTRSDKREYGIAHLAQTGGGALFKAVQPRTQVWMSHGDAVTALPPGFEVLGTTENCPYAAIADPARRLYGVQFHPEVVHTPEGAAILANFLHGICGLSGKWTMGSFIEEEIARIRAQVGGRHVLCGLSGGVDSSVAAMLIHRAIGNQLTCVFVNNGLLRKGEAGLVQRVFRDNFHVDLRYVDAETRFLAALAGVSDPEQKRKIIGNLFIDVFEEEARKIGDAEILAQGTLYPDVIESVSATGGPSVTIKSHHNVGGLPGKMKMELLEPLRELFKDEVRALGRELGLPEEIVGRHPFPGPGLGVRCVGPVTRQRLDTLRDADAIFIEEIKQAGLYDEIWQALVCLLPVRSVGVQGDERTYEEVCSLRAVTSEDAMTADWFRFPPEVLQRIANRICNEVRHVNRVLYDITSKPPGTIEWE
ncbi:MAG TPA: glutamine-hydrolyzing GMP synthase [Candidatus Hydrogenedentes bacterium]|nr:glutamine-hydrolyzing GMP synthase [Candidatus Hydrogenedentota bacterium]HQM49022.1 glutamine-hydrolyzing GMP synthase [Candidatus Hydrogenedentota bacterium]